MKINPKIDSRLRDAILDQFSDVPEHYNETKTTQELLERAPASFVNLVLTMDIWVMLNKLTGGTH